MDKTRSLTRSRIVACYVIIATHPGTNFGRLTIDTRADTCTKTIPSNFDTVRAEDKYPASKNVNRYYDAAGLGFIH